MNEVSTGGISTLLASPWIPIYFLGEEALLICIVSLTTLTSTGISLISLSLSDLSKSIAKTSLGAIVCLYPVVPDPDLIYDCPSSPASFCISDIWIDSLSEISLSFITLRLSISCLWLSPLCLERFYALELTYSSNSNSLASISWFVPIAVAWATLELPVSSSFLYLS